MKAKSLIDTSSLSEPIVKLIDVVSKAIGVLYEPVRLKKNAKANAAAMIIQAEAEIKIDEIEKRALNRFLKTEVKKQQNLDAIVGKSILFSPQQKTSDDLPDQDWISDFFDLSQNCSNEEMQMVWAKLLANEVDKPGSFSRKTLHVLKTLSSEDANLFNDFCGHLWKIEDADSYSYSLIILTDMDNSYDVGKDWWVSREGIQVLSNLDLVFDHVINFQEGWKFKLTDGSGRVYTMIPSKDLSLVLWSLTNVGNELFKVIEPPINSEYIDSSIDYIKSCGTDLQITEV